MAMRMLPELEAGVLGGDGDACVGGCVVGWAESAPCCCNGAELEAGELAFGGGELSAGARLGGGRATFATVIKR